MLKTKLAYMALGAVIASFGYFIGTLNNLNAEDDVARVKKLIVSEQIRVENEVGTTVISPGFIIVSGAGYITSVKPDTVNFYAPRDDRDKPRLSIGFKDTGPVKGLPTDPSIELRKPDGKRITLQVADEASIKLSNGGLKSKTVAVD